MQTDLLSADEVARLTRLSATTIWRLERRDVFPRRIKLGFKRVAWSEREVRDWIASRMQARQPASRVGAVMPVPAPLGEAVCRLLEEMAAAEGREEAITILAASQDHLKDACEHTLGVIEDFLTQNFPAPARPADTRAHPTGKTQP